MRGQPTTPREATRRRHGRLVSWGLGIGIGLSLLAAGAAFGFWIITVTSGSNFAEATAQTLPTGSTPTLSVTPASNQTVTIAFAQVNSSGGAPLTAYNVNRYAVGSTSHASISGSCAVVASVVTCTDVPGSGSWQYTDVPAIASSTWVGAESAKSTAAIVQAVTSTTVSGSSSVVVGTPASVSATLSNATTTPAPSGSITFDVFGPQAIAPSSCTGTGWSAVGAAVSINANGTYNASATYTPGTAGTYWWYAVYSGDTYNTASNSGCSASSTTVQLAVGPSSLPAATVYTAYSQTITASGGTSPYTYGETGALPTGLTLSSAGVLAGTISAAGQSGSYNFTVMGTDSIGNTGTKSYTLVVNAPTITLSSLTNPTGEAAYTSSVTASGGQAPYTYAKTSGTLPTGLSFSSAGAFSGTSSAPGSFTFTITATDGHGYPGSQSYTLTPVAPSFTFSPTSLPSATVYLAYSQTITTAGGLSAYAYGETGALPTGLTLSSGGVLSGTISATAQNGSYPITVTSTDADGFSGTKSYTLVVLAPAFTFSPASPIASATVYVTYGGATLTAAATNFSGDTFTGYSASGLPAGLTMSSTGAISGKITTSVSIGAHAFTVSATDANGYTATANYSITVLAPAFTFSPASPIASATVYVTYGGATLTAAATNFSGDTFTGYSASGLPAGLTMSSTGAISGKITTSVSIGAHAFTVSANDANGYTATANYSITVLAPAFTFSPASPIASATVYVTYGGATLTAAATNFSGDTFTGYSASGLPAGLTMSSTGAISGKITTFVTIGASAFTVSATDANGYTATANYSVTVIAPAFTFSESSVSCVGALGCPSNVTATATNFSGDAFHSYSAAGLPSGLSMSSSGVISGSTLSTGSFTITVTAVDVNGYIATGSYSLSVLL